MSAHARVPSDVEQSERDDETLISIRTSDTWDSNALNVVITAYFFASLATLIKTVAWWFNQWPLTKGWGFFPKWVCSASIAGFEYLPLTFSFIYASTHNVHLSLMTAYMEAADNLFRMIQQYALGKDLYWFDWLVAFLLAACVLFQGFHHTRKEAQKQAQVSYEAVSTTVTIPLNEAPKEDGRPLNGTSTDGPSQSTSVQIYAVALTTFFIFMLLLALLGGYSGQAYALATICTGAKTFAWWINQYPALREKTFLVKWLAGWGIAAIIEYLPLMGAFTIASSHNVHLGLMTAYMEALDNIFRMCQQYALGKQLYWFDWASAAGMVVSVLFQGGMHYRTSGGVAR